MSAQSKHTPGPLVADINAGQIPFRVYSKATQGTVGLFYGEADAELFASTHDMKAQRDELLNALKNLVAANDALGVALFFDDMGAEDVRDEVEDTNRALDVARAAIAKAEG